MKKKYLYTAIMLFAILVAGMGLTGWYVSQTQEQTDGQELTVVTSFYPMYIAAGLCIIGAFLPTDSQYSNIKTIGLFAGVILSIFNRPRQTRQ